MAATLAVIIFGCATFYSASNLLYKEEYALTQFQAKSRALASLEDAFFELESKLISYLGKVPGRNVTLTQISDGFANFQQKFINFNEEISSIPLMTRLPQEAGLTQTIQSHIIDLIPYLQNHLPQEEGQIPVAVLQHIDGIHDSLKQFTAYQLSQEMEFLDPGQLNKRHVQIFTAVSTMGVSGFLLILFLFYKNDELEALDKKHKQILKLAEQRIVAIEASNDGIGMIDPHGNLTYMNPALGRLHGIEPEDFVHYLGMPWKRLYSDQGRRQIDEVVYPALERSGAWRGISNILKKDGEVIEAEMSLTRLPDGGGMIGTARDMSERRQAEREKTELQAQIYQAQKMEAIGRLAGGIAHDFNNILAAIMGYAEFLSEDLNRTPKLQKFADQIIKASEKGRGLVDQMLSFSRRGESVKTVVDLRQSVAETCAMLSSTIPKTIELRVNDHSLDHAYANADPTQVIQVLMNLCVNACDAMEEDYGTLDITLNEVEVDEEMYEGFVQDELPPQDKAPSYRLFDLEPGRHCLEFSHLKKGAVYYQLSVTDTGSGMTAQVMEHIFEPFFTTKSVDKGTGLGMANVHGMVVSHSGAMVIESGVGQGTTIDLYLPRAEAGIQPQAATETLRATEKIGARVLLIDDEDYVREMLESTLERMGLSYESESSALDALFRVRRDPHEFDLIITDQNMPKMTGLELIQQLSADNLNIPVIIISGFSHERLQGMMEEFPLVKGVLRKPVRIEQFRDTIANVLKDMPLAAVPKRASA